MCSPVDRKRQSVDQFLVGNHLVLTGAIRGVTSFGLWTFFASHACWLISPLFATGVGLLGRSQKRSSSAMCDFSLHHVKSRPAKVGDKLTLFCGGQRDTHRVLFNLDFMRCQRATVSDLTMVMVSRMRDSDD